MARGFRFQCNCVHASPTEHPPFRHLPARPRRAALHRPCHKTTKAVQKNCRLNFVDLLSSNNGSSQIALLSMQEYTPFSTHLLRYNPCPNYQHGYAFENRPPNSAAEFVCLCVREVNECSNAVPGDDLHHHLLVFQCQISRHITRRVNKSSPVQSGVRSRCPCASANIGCAGASRLNVLQGLQKSGPCQLVPRGH